MSAPAPSRQTLDARALAKSDADAWQAHIRECARCARSRHSRGRKPPCARGGRLVLNVTQSAAALARELAEDAQPNPAQGALW